MKEDIIIGKPYPNPTQKNPLSYRFLVRYKDRHDGMKVRKHTPRWKDEKEAEKQRARWYRDYEKDRNFFAPPPPPAPEPEPEPEPEEQPKVLTFREYAEDYREWLKNNTKSESNLYHLKTLVDYFGDTPLAEIDYEQISKFEQTMRHTPRLVEINVRTDEPTLNPETGRMRCEVKKVTVEKMRSDSTVNHYLKRLRHLLYKAEREKKIPQKPDFYGTVVQETNETTVNVTHPEFEKLLMACDGQQKHFYLQVLCLFEAGVRLSEMKQIKKRDLDINSQFCRVTISKQKRKDKYRPPRPCYFSKRLIDAILADGFEEKAPDDFLFDQRPVKRVWKTVLKKAFSDVEDAMRREELLNMKMQKSLRKSARTNYLDAGVEEFIADYQLGHAPMTISQKHYQVVSKELQFREFQKFETYSVEQRSKLKTNAEESMGEKSAATAGA